MNRQPWPYGFNQVGEMRDVNVKVEVNVQTEDEPTAVALQLQQGGRDARCEHEDEGEREPVTKVNDEGERANGG